MRSVAAISPATADFCIAPDHPTLPGHFPSAPVVPGVLLLAEGLRQLEMLMAAPIRCRRIDSVKFLQPVPAGATVTAKLTLIQRGQTRVEFFVAGTLVAHLNFVATAASGGQNHG